MKILMIFQNAPYPPDIGPSKRNFPFFLETLKRHEVSVLSFGTADDEKKFRDAYGDRCRHVVFVNNSRSRILNFISRMWRLFTGQSSYLQFWSPKLQKALDRLIAQEKFDLIHCCTTILGYHELPHTIPLVGDMHNVEYDNVYRAYEQTKNILTKPYYYWEHVLLKRDETRITDKFNAVVTTTERDRDIIRKELPNKPIHVIPNGVDPAFFKQQPVEEDPHTIVFAGLMSYYPNYHGILYFLDNIFPLIREQDPQARLLVVGAYPPKRLQHRANEYITVTGFVDDVKPYFATGRVFAIPLLIGGGIRGKALEAMAMRRPIVSTTLGCEGINLKHEESALFADTPQDFADSVIRLLNDAALRKKLTDKAYQNVVEGYSWEVNGLTLERVYQALVPKADIVFGKHNPNPSRPAKGLVPSTQQAE